MIRPDASALELVVEASRDPITVLRICQSRLIEARDIATINFDEFTAAAQVHEIAAVLQAVAGAMKARALSPPWPRPGRNAVNAAVKAYEQDASVVPAAPDVDASPAWAGL